jgi:hypothetical protein
VNRTDPLFQSGYVGLSAFGHITPDRRRGAIGSWPAALEAVGVNKHARRKSPKVRAAWIEAGLPDLDHSQSGRPDSPRSPESKHGYRRATNSAVLLLAETLI